MTNLHKRADWVVQTLADLDRHEGFREFAYPDRYSKLGKKYNGNRSVRWGFRPGDIILAELGEQERDGRPWTVGHGFTRGVRPSSRISKEYSNRRLETELLEHVKGLDNLIPSWRKMPLFAQTVLANMIYNMGEESLSKFAPTLACFEQGRWGRAARRLRKTLWFKQVGRRAEELCRRLETQTIDPAHLIVKQHHTLYTGDKCIYVGDKK